VCAFCQVEVGSPVDDIADRWGEGSHVLYYNYYYNYIVDKNGHTSASENYDDFGSWRQRTDG